MPLYIRDSEVDLLAREVQKATGAQTKTDAVRIALQRELDRAQIRIPLHQRIGKWQDKVAALGPDDPHLDMKRFMDEGWGDI